MAEIKPAAFRTFGELARYLRERARLSQRELAARVDYHYSYISRLENGQVIPNAAAIKARFIPALELEDEPEWIARLLEFSTTQSDSTADESRAVHAPQATPVSLPVFFTPLLGRANEISLLTNLLQRPEIRLVTLVGPPGVGKTRLAIHAAQILAEAFTHGAIFVDLAPIEQAERVPLVLAKTLGIEDSDSASSMNAVLHALRGKQLLLLLDNFEQVISAAPQLSALLANAPQVKILVTSREALRISAEQEFPVKPFAVPQSFKHIEELFESPAIQIFTQRAQAVFPTFNLTEENAATIAEICLRLDGLPLALELAAARINILNPQSMLEQIDRRFQWLTRGVRDGHAWRQTLHGALEWSYQLLTDEEQVLLKRLSVFAGGWTLAAAEYVCYADQAQRAQTLRLLSQLADKSLVSTNVMEKYPRYHFLDSIRHFAYEKITTPEERSELRHRHLAYFAKWAEEAETMLDHIPPSDLLERAEAEQNNLRAALDWALQTNHAENEDDLRLAASASLIWLRHSHFKEGLEWARKFLPRARSSANRLLYAKLLYHSGALSYWRDDLTQAYDYCTEAEYLLRELGNPYALAKTLYYLGDIYREMGELERAFASLQECVALCRELNHQPRLARALTGLGNVLYKMGQHPAAESALAEALQTAEHNHDIWAEGYALRIQADLLRYDKKYQQALPIFQRALQVAQQIGDRISAGMALANLSLVCNLLEDYPASYAYGDAAYSTFKDIGNEYQQPFPLRMMAYGAGKAGDFPRARELALQSFRGNESLNHQTGMLACLVALTEIELAAQNFDLALQLHAYILARLESDHLSLMEPDAAALTRNQKIIDEIKSNADFAAIKAQVKPAFEFALDKIRVNYPDLI